MYLPTTAESIIDMVDSIKMDGVRPGMKQGKDGKRWGRELGGGERGGGGGVGKKLFCNFIQP